MVEKSILKNYQLWSDGRIILKDTILKIYKNQEEDKIYDAVLETYVEPPLLYCHIIDLEILDDNDDYFTGKVVKVREISY